MKSLIVTLWTALMGRPRINPRDPMLKDLTEHRARLLTRPPAEKLPRWLGQFCSGPNGLNGRYWGEIEVYERGNNHGREVWKIRTREGRRCNLPTNFVLHKGDLIMAPIPGKKFFVISAHDFADKWKAL